MKPSLDVVWWIVFLFYQLYHVDQPLPQAVHVKVMHLISAWMTLPIGHLAMRRFRRKMVNLGWTFSDQSTQMCLQIGMVYTGTGMYICMFVSSRHTAVWTHEWRNCWSLGKNGRPTRRRLTCELIAEADKPNWHCAHHFDRFFSLLLLHSPRRCGVAPTRWLLARMSLDLSH